MNRLISNIQWRSFALLCSLWLSPAAIAATHIDFVPTDMSGEHHARPNGLPKSVDWLLAPRLGRGNSAGTWTAMTAWGQVFRVKGKALPTNTRVAIRDLQAFVLSKKDRHWHRVQYSHGVEGAAYVEDFKGDQHIPIDQRTEVDGSLSVKLVAGYNFHFWPRGSRVVIDPQDIAGVVCSFQARLIPDQLGQRNDLKRARILAGAGGDYWVDRKAKWDDWKTNGDTGIGKLKYVTPQWQTFSMFTIPPSDIPQYPVAESGVPSSRQARQPQSKGLLERYDAARKSPKPLTSR